MDKQDILKLADMLYQSEHNRTSLPPLTELNTEITVEDAYAVQMANVERVQSMGHEIAGKKIGLTSPGIQKQLGVEEPDYGHLFAAMNCRNGIVDSSRLIQPKIEAELAFVLASDLSGGKVTADDVRDATNYVTGAFEIVDSRIADWKIKLIDTVADNASSGRYILGDKHLGVDEVDLSAVTMRLYKNDRLVEEGKGSAVLGDPCNSVAWLANRLWDYGVTLKKGEVVLSGAFSAAPPAKAGDVFWAEFSSFGTVHAKFC